MLIVFAGLSLSACEARVEDPTPETEPIQEIEEPEPLEDRSDSVRVIDDERSLENRIRDASIASRIRLALVEDPELRTFDFEPVVVSGRVRLRGTVLTASQRNQAGEVARRVENVREVINEVVATEAPLIVEQTDSEKGTPSAVERGDATGDGADATAEPAQETPTATYHTVRSGESLWVIARRYGVSVEQVQRLNNLGSSSIKPGQRLRIK